MCVDFWYGSFLIELPLQVYMEMKRPTLNEREAFERLAKYISAAFFAHDSVFLSANIALLAFYNSMLLSDKDSACFLLVPLESKNFLALKLPPFSRNVKVSEKRR